MLTPKGVREDFAQDLSTEEKETMVAMQAATQGAVLGTTTKPSWFVIASNDRAISPEQEKKTAERMGAKTLTLATIHVAMLSKPKEVANFIAEAAACEKAASSIGLLKVA